MAVPYPNLDGTAALTAQESALAEVWPLCDGDVVQWHDEGCGVLVDDACTCQDGPLVVHGPTVFA